ncbi:MAG: aldehyde dehydrogenase family protein [Candidatus Dadabacteria bacterium]|nr:MAG: aldehyde dehydrogenase family protein [Candidatus Dadabacteria bacterium]
MGRLWVGGRWIGGRGPAFRRTDPATGEEVWAGREAAPEQVREAVAAAARAAPGWEDTPPEERLRVLRRFQDELAANREELARRISRETGKPLWESRAEVDTVRAKVDLTGASFAERCTHAPVDLGGAVGRVEHRPLGVVAVLGPFNFPAHLPSGQIVPALLAGNAVVWKPSELTPGTGELLASLWEAAGLPPGVLNLVQGGAAVGRALATAPGVDGVFFTGGVAGGRRLHRALAGRVETLLALELGGNNPLVIWDDVPDEGVAAAHALLSAFVTTGQRCTCARRLILPRSRGGRRILDAVVEGARGLRFGAWHEEPEPFGGPLVTRRAALTIRRAWHRLVAEGGRPLLEPRILRPGGAFLSPGVVDASGLGPADPDREWFGPLLRVYWAGTFDEAVRLARATAFGLAAGLLTPDRRKFERFRRGLRAGVIHWNRPTTGASGRLPFGGLGASGNHRPLGYWAVDQCADPVAIQEAELTAPPNLPPGVEFGPLATPAKLATKIHEVRGVSPKGCG